MAELQLPLRMVCAGGSGAGKTFAVSQLLLKYWSPEQGIDRIVWVAPSYSLSQPIVKLLERAYPSFIKVDGSEGWTEKVREQIEQGINKGRKREANGFYKNDCFLIVDDMLAAAKRQSFVSVLYTTARHLGVSVIELAQRVFTDGSGRTQRLNCNAFMLFKFAGAPAEVRQLLLQTEDRARAEQVYQAYRAILERDPHGYLLLDLSEPDSSPKRYRDSGLEVGIQF